MKTGIRHIDNQKGVSLVLLALAIVVLFGFAALAVDVGHLYNVKNQLQVAADAAALAAVVELTGDGIAQTDARQAAYDLAYANYADVAYNNIAGVANEGQPIPVSLQLNAGNDPNGDIVVGEWDGTTFTPATGTFGETVNAVKVVARRTGAINTQPEAQNFFAKIFSLVNPDNDFALSNVAATAIAAKGRLEVLPIAVNEYWDEAPPPPPSGQAYGQKYPQSFMRSTNAGTIPGVPDIARGGQTFAIIGTEANSNGNSFDVNGFVNILYRFRHHLGYDVDPITGTIDFKKRTGYPLRQDSTTGDCSPTCGNNLGPIQEVNIGDVNSTKFQDNFSYLFLGIPDDTIPPNAVREVIRVTANPYIYNNYSSENGNDPSSCPHATIPYFSGSGSPPLNKKFSTDDPDFAYNGKRFWQVYPKGSRFLVMVYDGTIHDKDLVTVIGYGIIEIDGYFAGKWNGTTTLHDKGGTAYGHAIPHGMTSGVINGVYVADVSDTYLIQPPLDSRVPSGYPLTPKPSLPSPHQGTCEFTDFIQKVQESAGIARLVDPSLHYGVQ